MAGPVMKILALDDSLTIRKLIERVLTSNTVQLELAGSGQEGLDKVREFRPDLIFLDYILPDMKGTEVCELLSKDDALKDIPIIVMSAKGASVVSMFEGFSSVEGYLHKPFSPGKIASMVRDYIKKVGDGGESHAHRELVSSVRKTTQAQRVAPNEAAAKAIYTHLKEGFNRIPEWFPQLGVQPPGIYFAKRLLTPTVVQGILRAVEPFCNRSVSQEETTDLSGLDSLIGDQILVRTEGFAQRILGIPLSESDRLVLAMIDGRSSVRQIIEKSGIGSSDVIRIISHSLRRSLIHKANETLENRDNKPWWRRPLASRPS